jgi:hypothetical protein
MSCHQTAEQNHNINAVNKSLKNVANLKHLVMTVTNKYCIHEELRVQQIWGILAAMQFTAFLSSTCYTQM